jgi:hypothetical protein
MLNLHLHETCFVSLFLFFETEFGYVAQAGLELTNLPKPPKTHVFDFLKYIL